MNECHYKYKQLLYALHSSRLCVWLCVYSVVIMFNIKYKCQYDNNNNKNKNKKKCNANNKIHSINNCLMHVQLCLFRLHTADIIIVNQNPTVLCIFVNLTTIAVLVVVRSFVHSFSCCYCSDC